MEKPSVTIDLAPHLHDFIYNEFNTDRKMDGVLVNTVSDIGKMIEAMITISDRPPRVALKDSPIKLYLPIQNWNHRILAENFIFIPDWKQKQLQEYIEATYRIRIREYFVAGYEKAVFTFQIQGIHSNMKQISQASMLFLPFKSNSFSPFCLL